MNFVHSIAVSADDKHVYACSSLEDASGEVPLQNETLSAFSRGGDGSLTLVDQEIEGSGGVGPSDSGITVSPDGLFVTAASPFFGALATFSRATDGTLSLVESICDDLFVFDDGIGAVVDLAHSADGKNLYAAGGAFSLLTTVDSECDSPNIDLELDNDSINMAKTETACRSILAHSMYHVLASGDLTLEAPLVSFGNDFDAAGSLTVVNSVP